MSAGFKGFADDPTKDGNIRFNINADEIDNIIKSYKKLKKYQKSSMHEIEKLSGNKTSIDKLVDEYGMDSEAFE
jgi:hypothetical protein